MTPAPPERDRGAVLILTLVVVFVLGLTVTAIATYATTSLRAGPVAQSRMEQEAAAEAALVAALDQIRSGTSGCLYDTGTVEMTGFALTPNGTTVELECTNQTGPVPLPETWAVAVTGAGLSSTDLPLVVSTETDVFVGGAVLLPSLAPGQLSDVDGPLVAVAGPLLYTGSCSTPPTVLPEDIDDDIVFVTALVDRPVCTQLTWTEQPSLHAPAPPATVPPAIAPDTSGSCHVYSPGLYDDDPLTATVYDIPTVDTNDAYFKSGDYVFQATGSSTSQWDLLIRDGSHVIAGRSAAAPPEDFGDCEAAYLADVEGGATFHLSGRSFIDVRAGGTLEIAPRSGTDGRVVSIFALCDDSVWCDASAYPASAHTPNPLPPTNPNRNVLRVGFGSSVRIAGEVYAPLAEIRLTGNATDGSELLGGVTAARLSLGADVDIAGRAPSAASAPLTLLIEAAVTDPGGAETRMQASVAYTPTSPVATRVSATGWNLCDPAGC